MRFWLLVIAISCAGCGSGEGGADVTSTGAAVESCKNQFSPSAGYGWEDDLVVNTAPPGGGAPPAIPPKDRAASECVAAGQPASSCDANLLMTRDAALCVAKSLGLSSGIAAWKAGITHHFGLQRIVWNVASTIQDDGQGSQSGNMVAIDAISGTKFGESTWSSTP